MNSPVWLPASVSSQGTTIDRHFFVPQQVTAPQHDLDGNLVNDGRWGYLWDAENRLIQMESTAAAVQAGAPYRKLVFHYDAGGRRLARTVYHGTAAAPVFASSTRWLYDGWNPISEFSGTADTGGTITRTKSYTWGPDLSGTPQGAGGVGGLLAVIVHNGFTNSAYYPSYDGNGNIVAWTLEGTPAPVSRREYDAFGNTLVEQGVSPSAYGFSTKMQDAETGLYYYGYRYYDSVLGRWLSRDLIGERGGVNLNSFVVNSPTGSFDFLGMATIATGLSNTIEWDPWVELQGTTSDIFLNPIASIVTNLTSLSFKVKVSAECDCTDPSNPKLSNPKSSLEGQFASGIDVAVGSVGYKLTYEAVIDFGPVEFNTWTASFPNGDGTKTTVRYANYDNGISINVEKIFGATVKANLPLGRDVKASRVGVECSCCK